MDIHPIVGRTPRLSRRRFMAAASGSLGMLAGWTSTSHVQADVATAATPTNRARLLSDDSTALLHRLQLIDSARCELLMSVYEVGDDPIALRILTGLRDAAMRGVQVKLLVDGHGTNNLIPKPMMEHLISQAVALREHQPDVRYRLELGRQRMHDKLLVVDGSQLIIGGRNVRDSYYGMNSNPSKKNRWDREAFVTGPIVQQARNYFLKRWMAGTSGQPSLDRPEKSKTETRQQLAWLNELPRPQALACAAQVLDEARLAPLPYSASCCSHHRLECNCEPYIELDCVRFLHDIPEHAKDCPSAIAQQLNQALEQARHHVIISTPYLVMTKRLREILQGLRQRQVEVLLLTNSVMTTDRTIAHAQYANERRWMLRAGIEVWEMHGDRMLHAKSMVIDGHRSMIGSYNFDVLSETRNSETALLVDSAPLADALMADIVKDLMQALPVEEPLLGFDARITEVDERTLHKLRRQRLISPWIKKYL